MRKKKIIPKIKGLITRPISNPIFIQALFNCVSLLGAFNEIIIKVALKRNNTYLVSLASPETIRKNAKQAKIPANKKPNDWFDAGR